MQPHSNEVQARLIGAGPLLGSHDLQIADGLSKNVYYLKEGTCESRLYSMITVLIVSHRP